MPTEYTTHHIEIFAAGSFSKVNAALEEFLDTCDCTGVQVIEAHHTSDTSYDHGDESAECAGPIDADNDFTPHEHHYSAPAGSVYDDVLAAVSDIFG